MDEKRKKRPAILLLLILLGSAAMLLGVTAGSSGLRFDGLIRLIGGNAADTEFVIIRDLRMPRALLSYLVGAALAVAGCTMQGVFENPLADSHILGVSSGAGLGAAAAISLGIGTAAFGIGPVAVSAFIGGIAAAALVYGLSRVSGRIGGFSLILIGVALSSLFSAVTSFIMILDHDKMEQVLLWTMGSFASADWQKVRFAAAVIPAVSILVLSQARRLNIMLTGAENARLLGVDTVLTTRVLLLLTALLAAASVCSAGLIGFVGLMIPHILRALVGADHRYLIPASFLGGGMFLCLADTLARILVPPTEMPVGILTAVCGVPFFLYLARRQAGGGRHG